MANILIVDDERSICELLEITFRKEGHRVEITGRPPSSWVVILEPHRRAFVGVFARGKDHDVPPSGDL